jgi:murein DD-endopeptidase MepM/ murein hydrolase activator NlpD
MRPPVQTVPSRFLSRVAVVALLASFTAACSSDTSRFASFSNPFSNPFASGPQRTASVPAQQAYPTARVQSQPLAPVGGANYSRPIAAQPLPPVGSVATTPAARSPLPAYSAARPSGNVATGSVASGPRVSGFSKNGWSAEGGTPVVAREGDTVETLSNRYGVPADAIISVNGLSGPYLAPGQQITIPVYSLKHANAAAAKPPAVLRPAPAKALPTAKLAASVAREEPEPAPRPAKAPSAGGLHVVEPGETLTSIAKAYGTTRPRLAQANGIDEWTSVRIGQKLKVPGARQETAEAGSLQPKPLGKLSSRTSPADAADTPTKQVRTVEIKPSDSKPAAKPALAKVSPVKTERAKAAPEEETEEETAALPVTPVKKAAEPDEQVATEESASSGPRFRWPVRGRIIQSFGQNSDGINIAVPEGTEVKAAEGGVVAYAGNELKGYGNLVLIRHPDGFVTAYAHAKDVNVKRGDTVRRGQTIATAGQTGNVTSPQLLFELRKGATPVDPRQYLSGT